MQNPRAIAAETPAEVTASRHKEDEMKVRISEARLNDFAYVALKRLFFEPAGMSPREADIRIVMDLAAPERLTLASAILLPNEISPRSHDVFYEIDTENVLDVARQYIEDHWTKKSLVEPEREEEFEKWKREEWEGNIVPVIMRLPEEECATTVEEE